MSLSNIQLSIFLASIYVRSSDTHSLVFQNQRNQTRKNIHVRP